jgi:hypothetical protein
LVAARIERGYGGLNVDFDFAQFWAMGKVEDGLFRCGHQRRSQGCVDALGVQAGCVTCDEPDDGRPIRQFDLPVLAGHGDRRGSQGAGNRSVQARRASSWWWAFRFGGLVFRRVAMTS